MLVAILERGMERRTLHVQLCGSIRNPLIPQDLDVMRPRLIGHQLGWGEVKVTESFNIAAGLSVQGLRKHGYKARLRLASYIMLCKAEKSMLAFRQRSRYLEEG